MNNAQKLLEVLGRNAKKLKKDSSYGSISDTTKNYRWIDFIDPKNNCPALLLEWLWGGRGMLAGRMLKIDAPEGSGKSSYLMLQYAMAQKTNDAFCILEETEHAIQPPDYIASFGADPDRIVLPQMDVRSLENLFKDIDCVCAQIRSDVDPEKKVPIVVGLDSISAAGTEDGIEEESFDMSKGSLGEHARVVSKWFRDRFGIIAGMDTLLVIIAQQREKINSGGFARPGETKTTTIAAKPLDYHASYRLTMYNSPIKESGREIGATVNMTVKKNKVSGKGKTCSVPLYWGRGFDLQSPCVELLARSPVTLPSGDVFQIDQSSYVKCPMLNFSERSCPEAKLDLMRAIYANEPLLMGLREALQVRGFGFSFENWKPVNPDGE